MLRHAERHLIERVGWLRAAVLGANDGVISTGSLIMGVAAASADRNAILIAGLASLVAGAMSMAAGEYVSVSSQADAEAADLARETAELREMPEAEHRELAAIYEARGLDPTLAAEVARQLMAKDALSAHARDELGMTETTAANPLQAAGMSAVSFAVGAALPLAAALASPDEWIATAVAVTTVAALALLGATGARLGGASIWRGTLRVTFWGAVALGVTYAVGRVFGVAA
ncbi:MAG: VIT family protein [Hyphomicrobiales bacterium]|nr:VIT family protein [Hyphomicrobiales bacterium]